MSIQSVFLQTETDMKYSIDKQDEFAVIQLLEEKLDSRIAPKLKGEFVILNNEGIKNIILDLSTAKYVDSSGLSSILTANRLCMNSGRALALCGITDHVEKMIRIAHLDTILNIFQSKDDAEKNVVNLTVALEEEVT